jgi:uncharacterized protein YecE (DUF72 family)
MNRQGAVYIGTSGWNYKHWRGPFYPENMSDDRLLRFYADHFGTVEVNNSFYHLPEKKTFGHWKDTVGEDFVFAVKASRYITHMKKLKCGKEPVNRLLGTAEALKGKKGPVLFQLPPRWKKNADRLRGFLDLLPEGNRYTFEFRDETWFSPDIYELLRERNMSFCIYELDRKQSPREVTADFVYVRLHGPEGAYKGSYSERALSGWAGAFSAWRRQGKDIYCYFDNDQNAYAAENAAELKSMME